MKKIQHPTVVVCFRAGYYGMTMYYLHYCKSIVIHGGFRALEGNPDVSTYERLVLQLKDVETTKVSKISGHEFMLSWMIRFYHCSANEEPRIRGM